MTKPQVYISLREVGRQLGIPPSTVVYYKDRFAAYIPSEGGDGRRKRYPQSVLDIFRSIREMFDNNWSAEQIEQALEKGTAPQPDTPEPVPPFGSGDPAKAAARARAEEERAAKDRAEGTVPLAVLEQLTILVRDQAKLAAAVKGLARELEALREERAASAGNGQERIEQLEAGLAEVRTVLAELGKRVSAANGKPSPETSREEPDKAAKTKPAGKAKADSKNALPSEAFLSRPLVIRTVQGEYLGVLGGGRKHFTLGDFIALMERNISARRSIETRWEHRSGRWTLVVRARDKESGSDQSILLVVCKTTTPSKNVVTEIVRLNIDGSDVPDSLLLSLFKQVRDELSGTS